MENPPTEIINVEKRKKLAKAGKIIGAVFAGILASKFILGDIYLGQEQKQTIHLWQEAIYNTALTRDGNSDIATVTRTKPKGDEVITVSRTGEDITSYQIVYDGVTKTVTINRDGSENIIGWTVS
jgi:hypothetical protein